MLEKVDTLGPPGTAETPPEVVEGSDCTQQTIYNNSLVDDGIVETKEVASPDRRTSCSSTED